MSAKSFKALRPLCLTRQELAACQKSVQLVAAALLPLWLEGQKEKIELANMQFRLALKYQEISANDLQLVTEEVGQIDSKIELAKDSQIIKVVNDRTKAALAENTLQYYEFTALTALKNLQASALQEELIACLTEITAKIIGSLSLQQFVAILEYFYLRLAYNQRINLSRITSPTQLLANDLVDCCQIADYILVNLAKDPKNSQALEDHEVNADAKAANKLNELKDQVERKHANFSKDPKHPHMQLKDAKTVLDMGTGAGVPGLLLAIILPNFEFTLLDTVSKKLAFLAIVIEQIGLKNVKLLWDRLENYAHTEARASFQIVTARALAELASLVEYAAPFLEKNGQFICLKNAKSARPNPEKLRKQVGMKLEKSISYGLANEAFKRCLLIFNQDELAPAHLPRANNLPRTACLDIIEKL